MADLTTGPACHDDAHNRAHPHDHGHDGRAPAAPAALPAKPAPTGTAFTWPMHPQVRQAGPGACPICGPQGAEGKVARAPLAPPTRRFAPGHLRPGGED